MKSLYIHPDNPQARMIDETITILRDGGVMIFPTALGYAFGLSLSAKSADHHLPVDEVATLLCRDLSQVSDYATINNEGFRTLKAHTPSPISFVLPATKHTPKKLHSKQKTINIQIQHSPIILAILEKLGEPILTYFLTEIGAISEPYEIEDTLDKQAEVLLNVGTLSWQPTTIVDMTTTTPTLLQQGATITDGWAK